MTGNDGARMPEHERRRRELLAVLDAPEPPRRRATALVAAGVVLVLGAVTVAAVQPWANEELAPAGPQRGQDRDEGVPEESARVGDPVPWEVATRVLAACLVNGRRAAIPPPMPTMRPDGPGAGLPTGPPSGIGSDTPTATTGGGPISPDDGRLSSTNGPLSSGGAGGTTVAGSGEGDPYAGGGPWDRVATPSPADPGTMPPLSPDASVWGVTEPDADFVPYFTAWEPSPAGGLRPYVLGKARGPGLVPCHVLGTGEASSPMPDLPAPIGAEGTLIGSVDIRQAAVYADTDHTPVPTNTWWGRTASDAVRVTLTAPDGTVIGAVVRDGVWFADTSSVAGDGFVARAYDAGGVPLPGTGSTMCTVRKRTEGCGPVTRWE